MIDIISYDSMPFTLFEGYYNRALDAGQLNIEAMCLSTANLNSSYSRMVNIKYICNDKIVFFSNYDSNKGKQIEFSQNVSCLFFWPTINMQIRMLGDIKKCKKNFSDEHFRNRSQLKNALAISSNQSAAISSFSKVKQKFDDCVKNKNFSERPDYWGGYEIEPVYFEFWKGGENRLNKREEYNLVENEWVFSILEP